MNLPSFCSQCQKPKATLTCETCSEILCKSCAEFISENAFPLLTKRPAEIAHSTYCTACYSNYVLPFIEKYKEIENRAKDIKVFDKTQGKETRLIKKTEDPITVNDCSEYQEALMKLAYLAAEKNFNTLVDVDIKSKKIRIDSYQTSLFFGSGIPAKT